MKAARVTNDYMSQAPFLTPSPVDHSSERARPLYRSDNRAADLDKIRQGVTLILEGIGEDLERVGLTDTPERVARMYKELCSSVHVDPATEISCTFSEGTDDLVIVKDIFFASICEHHLVPFLGSAHIAYLPTGGRITGLSKLARVVECAARRPQVQERMTNQIAEAISSVLRPQGLIVLLEAEHLCMSIRGVKKPGSQTVTAAVRGIFRSDVTARQEAMSLIRQK